MRVSIVIDEEANIIHVASTKKRAKKWLRRVKDYQEGVSETGEFDDHWWLDIELECVSIETWEVA